MFYFNILQAYIYINIITLAIYFLFILYLKIIILVHKKNIHKVFVSNIFNSYSNTIFNIIFNNDKMMYIYSESFTINTTSIT